MKFNFKVGDSIVEDGIVYEIFKIEAEKDQEPDNCTIFFKPVYADENALIGSIPVQNIDSGEIRTPSSVSEVNEMLKTLSRKGNKNKVDTDILEEKMKTNQILDVAEVANLLWKEKKDEDISFSPTKRRIFNKAVRSISEEYAYVKETSIENAEKRIKHYLNKSL